MIFICFGMLTTACCLISVDFLVERILKKITEYNQSEIICDLLEFLQTQDIVAPFEKNLNLETIFIFKLIFLLIFHLEKI